MGARLRWMTRSLKVGAVPLPFFVLSADLHALSRSFSLPPESLPFPASRLPCSPHLPAFSSCPSSFDYHPLAVSCPRTLYISYMSRLAPTAGGHPLPRVARHQFSPFVSALYNRPRAQSLFPLLSLPMITGPRNTLIEVG